MNKCVCWICYSAAAPTLKGVVRHMAVAHAHDPGFHVSCGIGGCSRTYSNFYSFKKHLYRKHREHLDIATVSSATVTSLSDSLLHDTEYEPEAGNLYDTDLVSTSITRHKKQMALFILKLKEVRKVSQTAIDGLVCDFTLIIQQIISQLQNDVSICLQDNGLNFSNINGLLEVFSDPFKLNPFTQLESKFLQEKFYKEHLDLLVSRINYIAIATPFNIGTNKTRTWKKNSSCP